MKGKSCTLIFSLALLFLLLGCGKKAVPLPRLLPLPGAIGDLAGEVKDGVLFLSFSLPEKNEDGSEAKEMAGFRILKRCNSCYGGFDPFKDVRLDEARGYAVRKGRVYVYDDDFVVGALYSYKVHSFTARGTLSAPSKEYTIRWERPPEAPKGVQVAPGDGAVEITWTGEAGALFNVYRYENGVYPLFPRNERPLRVAQFVETGLDNNRPYQYEVRRVAERNGSLWEGTGVRIEAVPSDRTPPSAPLNLTATKEEGGVLIAWAEAAEKDLAGYNLFRVAGNKVEKLNEAPLKETSFLDTRVPDYRYISYYATSVDHSGNESGASREHVVMLKP